MKKIMFNDKFGLTKAVLEGRKTMTRREVKIGRVSKIALDLFKGVDDGAVFKIMIDKRAHYKVGEVVAIAQSYKDCVAQASESFYLRKNLEKGLKDKAGWSNKMFTKAELMPHNIRITNIRVERLQDISDEDCLQEGVRETAVQHIDGKRIALGYTYENDYLYRHEYHTACNAFEALINKVSGKGTWERNPYVFVYEFELVD